MGGMTAKHTDSEEDHNTNELHNLLSHSNESLEYNTLQHGNAANIHTPQSPVTKLIDNNNY